MHRAILKLPIAVVLAWFPCAASAAPAHAAFAAAARAASAVAACVASRSHGASPVSAQADPSGGAAGDRERVIPVHELPAPVRAALASLGKGITVLEVKENVDGGRVTYEIDLVEGNVYREVELDAAGNVIGSEVEARIVAFDSVPEPARRAIEREAAGGAILEVREEEEEDLGETVYEAVLWKGARIYALRIDARGALIERDITLEMLPPGAYLTLLHAAQGGSIVELDEELHDGRLSYEANLVIGDVELEISVDADGNLVELDC